MGACRMAGTRSGGRRLSDLARHVVLPDGIVSTAWPDVARQLERMDVPLDEWQQGWLTAILAKRENGQYACGIGGAVASIPRQSGKTHAMGALAFALCAAYPNMLVLWSAHRAKTHNETFRSMSNTAQKPKVAPFIKTVRTGANTEAIEFVNGSRILFGSREHGFGRGFAKVDVLVLDEAQILDEKSMEDMVPATNAAPNGLVLLMGTPPRPADKGEVFTNRRREALAGDKDTLYVEFSADPDARPDDRKQWAIANPSYPARTKEGAILRMRKLLGSEDSFFREGLGIWREAEVGRAAISAEDWEARVSEPPTDGVRCFGVKFSSDGAEVAVAAAVRPDGGGPVYVEGIASRPAVDGTQWAVDFLAERGERAAQIVVDGKSGAAYLVQALLDAGVPKRTLITPSVEDVKSAHSMFASAVRSPDDLAHGGQDALTEQATWALKREIGKDGAFGWRAPEGESVALLDAATFAFWAAKTTKRRPGRRARIL